MDEAPPCLCAREPHARFYGDSPLRTPDIDVLEQPDDDPPWWRVRCRRCDTRWTVFYIPGGGIYGDFEWERAAPPASSA